MVDKSRSFFQLRPASKNDRYGGLKLLWRYPCADRRRAAALAPLLPADQPEPQSIAIGRFIRIDGDTLAFIPSDTPLAIAALGIDSVRDRLAEDIALLLSEPERVP